MENKQQPPQQQQQPPTTEMVESSIACDALRTMASERHGDRAGAIVMQLWSDTDDARFLLMRTRGRDGTAAAAAYASYRMIGREDDASEESTTCFVSDLYVRPAFRRRGLARRILRRLTQPQDEGSCETAAWSKVQLHVMRDNEPAVQLYRSEGFKELSPADADAAWTDRGKHLMEFTCARA